jgi:hypothetical protein
MRIKYSGSEREYELKFFIMFLSSIPCEFRETLLPMAMGMINHSGNLPWQLCSRIPGLRPVALRPASLDGLLFTGSVMAEEVTRLNP